jgi:hypothetical protein
MLKPLLAALALLALCQQTAAFMPGPISAIRCPDSLELRLRTSMASGNTAGGLSWTDGFGIYPSLPSFPALSRCGPSGRLYRVDEAIVVGSQEWWTGANTLPENWSSLKYVEATTADDLHEALDAGWAKSIDEEADWRLQIWWSDNDAIRTLDPTLKATSPFATRSRARDNLLRLLTAQQVGAPHQRLLKAEMLRQLGLFSAARQTLQGSWPEELEALAQQIRKLARARDPLVRPVQDENWKRIFEAVKQGRARRSSPLIPLP